MMRLLAVLILVYGQTEARAAERFQDCDFCPQMVVVRADSYQMGTPLGAYEVDAASGEGPPIRITIGRAFALSRAEVTVAQFQRFTAATGHRRNERCAPASPPSAGHPVSCVNFADALAYSQWLASETGQSYRLPSESEWEFAARAGTPWPRPWGANNSFEGVSISLTCDHANVYDIAAQAIYPRSWPYARCDDGFAAIAPVASFPANDYGLHDMVGNVREWTADCFTASYWGRPPDERAWTWGGGCEQRVVRGGGWLSRPTDARPARRHGVPATARNPDLGFRVARELSDAESPAPKATLRRITLFTADVEAAKAFWSQGFGYRVSAEDPNFGNAGQLQRLGLPPDARLHFVMLAPANPAEPLIGLLGTRGGEFQAPPRVNDRPWAGQALVVLKVADLELTLAKLADLGVPLPNEVEPLDGPTGIRGYGTTVITPDGTSVIVQQLNDP